MKERDAKSAVPSTAREDVFYSRLSPIYERLNDEQKRWYRDYMLRYTHKTTNGFDFEKGDKKKSGGKGGRRLTQKGGSAAPASMEQLERDVLQVKTGKRRKGGDSGGDTLMTTAGDEPWGGDGPV